MTGTIDALDLNLLRVFERVAALGGFSAAARALGLPKSNVSRSVAMLEATLGARLFQRTTRSVVVTAAGEALRERCASLLEELDEAIKYVGGLADTPRGHIRISAGVSFGINVLSELLPLFLERYSDISVTLDLSTRLADLVREGVDCAVRIGPLPDSSLVSSQLGAMHRYLCASPAYLAKRGRPSSLTDLSSHDTIELPGPDGRAHPWLFQRKGESIRIDPHPRILVDEALTIYRLIRNGAGIGIVSAYLCGLDIRMRRLTRLIPEWSCPSLPVSLVYPSRRELSPAVRAFADFMKETSTRGQAWHLDPLAERNEC
jgi:LysR family transcriptional regulator, regulator for bpeEF and oprC